MNMPVLGADFNGGNIKMSSREIADLCEKRHDHVLRDIEKMLQDIDAPNFGAVDFEAKYQDSKGEWRKEYRLPKDLTVTLITGYRADLRYKVVKRLEELEADSRRGAFQVPRTFGEALRLAADRAEQIEAMRPKVVAMERMEASEGAQLPRVAAKALGVQERKFFRWLHSNSWAFRQGKTWQGYSDKIKQGLLEHEPHTYTVPETGEERTKVQMKITPKGMSRLAQVFAAEGGAA